MHGALPGRRDRFDLSKLPNPGASLPSLELRVNSIIYYVLGFLILLATYGRRSIHDKHDFFKCNALLQRGQWLDPPSTGRSTPPYQKWQPDGCMLRGYNSAGTSNCLGSVNGRDAVFIGDSTVREVFWAAARKLDSAKATKEIKEVKEKHADVLFKHKETVLEFIWDPFLNGSKLLRHVEASRLNGADPRRVELPNSKALVVVGGGLWYARIPNGPSDYKAAMDKIAASEHQDLQLNDSKTPGSSRVYYLPVQPPFYDRLDLQHKESLNRDAITEMNKFVRDMPVLYQVDVLLSFVDMVEGNPEAYQPNGLHVIPSVADIQADIILNARCNEQYQTHPYASNCCYEYITNFTQSLLIFSGVVGLLFTAYIELQGEYFKSPFDHRIEPLKKHLPLLRAIFIVWAALIYCWICDRTQLFNKISKQFNNQDFFIFCFGMVLVGGCTIRRSVPSNRSNQDKPMDVDQPFLSRDQTDEWKGWMQAMILAYHYTGASRVLWIYRIIRLLVASYLFMTGYGHAAYFYQKGDFSLKRVVAVNLRLNLLSCLLPWMMNSDYLFYYFAPLVTYWYIVVYATMRIKAEWNQRLPMFLGKVAAAAATTTILHTQPALFDPLFLTVNYVFGSKWETREWLFRVSLDQYIVYCGMIMAVLYIRQSRPPSPPAPPQDGVATTAHTHSGGWATLTRTAQKQAYILDALALLVYGVVSTSQTSKVSSNAVHTYVSPLAVLAFVHLRNATPAMRNHYLAAYAWLGKVSLETFILQYHMWLAGDTKGLLSTGVFGEGGMHNGGLLGSGMGVGRWLDCGLLGVIFIWISQHVAKATNVIANGAVKGIFG